MISEGRYQQDNIVNNRRMHKEIKRKTESNKMMKMSTPISQKDLEVAEDIDFEEEKETWNTYKLKDGSTLRTKLILTGVKRLKKYAPDGTPLYVINSTNSVRVLNVPKILMGKPRASSTGNAQVYT